MTLTYKVMCIQSDRRDVLVKDFEASEVIDGDLMTDRQLWPHALKLINKWNRDATVWRQGVLWHYYLNEIGEGL